MRIYLAGFPYAHLTIGRRERPNNIVAEIYRNRGIKPNLGAFGERQRSVCLVFYPSFGYESVPLAASNRVTGPFAGRLRRLPSRAVSTSGRTMGIYLIAFYHSGKDQRAA